MRIESSVTSLSWIPLGAMEGAGTELAFRLGIAHYDPPPPETLEDLEALRAADRFRFANELRAWIEVEDGRIVDHGHAGGGLIGSTTLRLGSRDLTFVAFPDVRPKPELGDGWVRFVQSAGGRTGAPAPRRIRRPPFVQWIAPAAWSTLALTIHADGQATYEVVGASPFPRHWIYDHEGTLVAKTGRIDFDRWFRETEMQRTPWGDEDSPALVVAAETALERRLSVAIIDGKPSFRRLQPARPWSSRATPAPTSTSCSTACSGSRSTARRSPSSARGRGRRDGPARGGGARPPCGRSPPAGSPWSPATSSTATPSPRWHGPAASRTADMAAAPSPGGRRLRVAVWAFHLVLPCSGCGCCWPSPPSTSSSSTTASTSGWWWPWPPSTWPSACA